jgi:hypothetical protein
LRSPYRAALWIVPLLLLVGSTLAVQATTVQAQTLPELVQRSTTIVHGTVQETHVAWEGGRARLYTYVTVAPREVLKGRSATGGAITFRQLGGRDGDQVIYVPGTPRFSAKQEILVFLTGEDSGGYPQVMGIFQGAFRPALGPGGVRRVEGLSSATAGSIVPDKPEAAGRAGPVLGGSFTDFLERVRSLVEQQQGHGAPR